MENIDCLNQAFDLPHVTYFGRGKKDYCGYNTVPDIPTQHNK